MNETRNLYDYIFIEISTDEKNQMKYTNMGYMHRYLYINRSSDFDLFCVHTQHITKFTKYGNITFYTYNRSNTTKRCM